MTTMGTFVRLGAAVGITAATVLAVPNAAHADTTTDLCTLQALPGAPSQPALSVGPEVGWNAGLESMRPPTASMVRLWDMKTAWRDINPADGVFDFSILDKRIALAEQWGARPVLVLGLTPQWAASGQAPGAEQWGAGSTRPPASIESWKAYVSAVVARYGSRIGAYEIWNEANLQTFWTGSVQQMMDLTTTASAIIGDTATVIAPSVTTRLASGRNFTKEFAGLLGSNPNVIDAWTIHSYPAGNAGTTPADAASARRAGILAWQQALVDGLPEGSPYLSKQIWDTEVNYGLAGPGDAPHTDFSDADAATLVQLTYADSQQLGIDQTFWYEFTAASFSLLGAQMTPGSSAAGAFAGLPAYLANQLALQRAQGCPAKGAVATSTGQPIASQARSIVITGSRTTVFGKPGISVDGDTTGFTRGSTVVPMVRFPGQTSYTEGTARPVVDSSGAFTWSRKTGKKTYVYFTTEDRSVQSNRVIIPAN